MAVHQYIGARYVPYYYENSLDPTSTEWEPNVHYEALTVVTLPNLHSYISKKDVPDTIGSPALNAEYWLDTGSDNAYIQDLQDQIDAIVLDVTNIQDDITDLNRKKALILADSYGAYTNSNSENMADVAERITGISVDFLHNGGYGFVSDGVKTFLSLIGGYTGDPNDITDIIVCGGANDYSDLTNESTLIAAIKTFCDYCKITFPNLKRIALMATSIVFGPFLTYKGAYDRVFTAHCYQMGANLNGAVYITNSQYIMHDTRILLADLCHPTQSGVDVLGAYLAQVLRGADSVNVSRYYEGSNNLTLDASMVALGGSLPATYKTRMYRQNGTAELSGNAGVLSLFNLKTTSALTFNNVYTLGELDESLIDMCDDDNNGWFEISGRMYTQPNQVTIPYVPIWLFVQISGKRIRFIPLFDNNTYSCYGFVPNTGCIQLSGN